MCWETTRGSCGRIASPAAHAVAGDAALGREELLALGDVRPGLADLDLGRGDGLGPLAGRLAALEILDRTVGLAELEVQPEDDRMRLLR